MVITRSRYYRGQFLGWVLMLPLMLAPLCSIAEENGGVRFEIQADPFLVTIVSATSGPLGAGPDPDLALPSVGIQVGEHWYPIVRIQEWKTDGSTRRTVGVTSGGHPVRLEWTTGGASHRLRMVAGNEAGAVGYSFSMERGDYLVGMGQRFTGLQLRGQEIPADDQEWTVPIPFFMSSAGYGVFLETNKAFSFDFGKRDPSRYLFRVQSNEITIHIIGGPNPSDMLHRYVRITGTMMRPPDWMFGLWKWRDWVWNEFELYEDASMLTSLDIPASIMLIDSPWSAEYFDFEFNQTQFPQPDQLVSNLKRLGFRTILWVAPFINEAAKNYEIANSNGYLVKDASGGPYKLRWWNPSGSPDVGLATDPYGYMVDFTNPEAKTWWQNQVAALIDLGVVGFKVDGGELLPEDAYLFDGRRGYEVKDYPALYLKALYEVLKEKRGAEFILLPRAGWAGSQQWSPAFWAADQSSDFNDHTGLPSVIRGAQGMGLVGFPFWGSDIGGYQWSPTKEVFIRWTQFGAFSPVMQTGGKSIHEPWLYDDETVAIFRKYVQLYTHMRPYLMHFADEAAATGSPVMRPMFYAYPADKQAWNQEMQYMYGSHLLVAPVYSQTNRRDVYLPEGRWMDFWDHSILKGKRTVKNVAAPLWKIPLFVRVDADAISLLYEPMLHEQITAFHNRVAHYLRGDAKFMRVRHQNMMREAFHDYLSAVPEPTGLLSQQDVADAYLAALRRFHQFLKKESETGQVPYHVARTLGERITEIERTLSGLRVLGMQHQ